MGALLQKLGKCSNFWFCGERYTQLHPASEKKLVHGPTPGGELLFYHLGSVPCQRQRQKKPTRCWTLTVPWKSRWRYTDIEADQQGPVGPFL